MSRRRYGRDRHYNNSWDYDDRDRYYEDLDYDFGDRKRDLNRICANYAKDITRYGHQIKRNVYDYLVKLYTDIYEILDEDYPEGVPGNVFREALYQGKLGMIVKPPMLRTKQSTFDGPSNNYISEPYQIVPDTDKTVKLNDVLRNLKKRMAV